VAKIDQQWWITARGLPSRRSAKRIKPFLFSEVTAERGLERKMP
jgi:hypothetical protein